MKLIRVNSRHRTKKIRNSYNELLPHINRGMFLLPTYKFPIPCHLTKKKTINLPNELTNFVQWITTKQLTIKEPLFGMNLKRVSILHGQI